MECISTKAAPAPTGHYSQAVVANGFIFVSGQLPRDPRTGEIPARIADQTRRALENVRLVLLAAGSDIEHIVSLSVYVTDMTFWPEVDAALATTLGAHKPARIVAVSPALHFGNVEVQAIAAMP